MKFVNIKEIIELDFSKIEGVDQLYVALAEKIGFPEDYGKNVDTVIDCLFGLRYPEDRYDHNKFRPNRKITTHTKNITNAQKQTTESLILII